MKKTLMALLLGTVIATTPVRSYAVDGKTQSAIFYSMAGLSLLMNSISLGLAVGSGTFTWFNMDVSSYVMDALEIMMYKKRRTHWKGLPEKLQANQRLIGSFEDLESYQASQEYATETDVHAMALTTTGIEALFDDGNVNAEVLQPAVVTSSAMTAAIQEQFGTPELDDAEAANSAADASATAGVNPSDLPESAAEALEAAEKVAEEAAEAAEEAAEKVDPNSTHQMQEKLREGISQEQKELQRKRRIINKQKTALTGVAKAELLQSASAMDNSKKRISQLESFVGRGESLLGQVKILAGLELELGGRLNLLDAVQANTLAVDAAAALLHVE